MQDIQPKKSAPERKDTTVVVLGGGVSDEREVSLRSSAAVSEALQAAEYYTRLLDPANPDDEYDHTLQNANVVFPVLHGKGGEDGTIQQYLEEHSIPFVGSSASTSRLCYDKWEYKAVLTDAGLQTPRGSLVDADSFKTIELTKRPFVLKPFSGGSSIDTFIVRDPSKATMDAMHDAFSRHPQMLIEELIEGIEITVGVLADQALPVIEIIPPSDGEFDYENKYNGRTREVCPSESLSEEVQQKARNLALQIHQLLDLRDLSRTDMIVTETGDMYILETNTIPGMTAESLFPKAAHATGYDMPKLVQLLVTQALGRA